MQENPYNYTGPLHPIHDSLVCIPRKNELEKVISGILRGDYWTILGPRQIGKTTFLNQLISELAAFNCIYFDMESCPRSDAQFYAFLIDAINEQISNDEFSIQFNNEKDFGPEINFYNFLKAIKNKSNKKIMLFFDEIERTPIIRSFLKLWRKIFNERNYHPELEKYGIVIAGSVDLIALTLGPTSPFNISKKLYMEELHHQEAKLLIENPLKLLNIELDTLAKEELLSLTCGHPQLLQQLCFILVELALKEQKSITKPDVKTALDILLTESDHLGTLANDVENDKKLEDLIERIMNKEEIKFLPYQKYSIAGTGPIVQRNKLCSIRNNIYEHFLKKVLDSLPIEMESVEEPEYVISIPLKNIHKNLLLDESHERFLKKFFGTEIYEIGIAKNGIELTHLDLDFKEGLIFYYLAYKRYKSIEKGLLDWKKIPPNSEYRLSSNVENNRGQLEWDILEEAFASKRITIYDEIIRSWIMSLRHKLKMIDAPDLIPIESGRGRGYFIKSRVEFIFT